MNFDDLPIGQWPQQRSQRSSPSPAWQQHQPELADAVNNNSLVWLAYSILYPVCLCLLNFFLAIGAWLCLLHPLRLYRLLRWFGARRAGLRYRLVRLDGAMYRLAEKGRPDPLRPSVLLLHSVADDCTVWTDFVRLADQFEHVIAVDLPGHGGSLVSPDEDFDFGPLANRVRAVLVAAGFAQQRLHAVGCGVGAGVALALAAVWPEQTELLTLVAPLLPPKPLPNIFSDGDVRDHGERTGDVRDDGGRTDDATYDGGRTGDVRDDRGRTDDATYDGGRTGDVTDDGGRTGDVRDDGERTGDVTDDGGRTCEVKVDEVRTKTIEPSSSILKRTYDSDLYSWLLPADEHELVESVRRRFYRPTAAASASRSWLWRPMRNAWLADRLPRLDFYRALLANLVEEPGRSDLLALAGRVRQPTQIVWGAQDEISPISGAELLRDRLPNLVQFDLIDECGHCPETECPSVLYNLVYKFRKNMSFKKFN